MAREGKSKTAAQALEADRRVVSGRGDVLDRARHGWQRFRRKNSNLNAFVHEYISGMKNQICVVEIFLNSFCESLFMSVSVTYNTYFHR